MRGFVALAAFAATGVSFFAASTARAFVDFSMPAPTVVAHYDFGQLNTDDSLDLPTPGSIYSNVDTFSGFAAANGGTVVNAGNGNLLTTRYLADDLNSAGGSFDVMSVAGWSMKFSVANLNAAATTARFRIRFFLRDGAGGAPGTALGGFSFATTSIPTGVSTFTATNLGSLGAGIPPSGTTQIWAGMFFDNSGAAATTAAQLDNLGQGLFNPPVIGTSADQDFLSGAATNTFLVNNPAGAVRPSPFAANPVANYGWEITPAPEPTSLAVLGLSIMGFTLRRRRI